MQEWTDRASPIVKSAYGPFEPEGAVLQELASFKSVLEIGSGMGRYPKLLPHVIGLEYSRQFLEYCAKNVPGVFLRGDGFKVPIRDDAFQCVFSSGVIEHFDDLQGITNEHARVCEPGGTVLIAVPAKDSPDAVRVNTRQRYLRSGEQSDWHYYGRRLSDNEVRGVMQEAGLTNIQLRHLGTPLRGSREALAYLRPQLLRNPITLTKGMVLELGGYINSKSIFRKLTGDFVNKRYSSSRGYYLLASGQKQGAPPQPENQPVIDYAGLKQLLVCPKCRQPLSEAMEALTCQSCEVCYPVRQGVPYLTESDAQPLAAQVANGHS